MGTDLGIIVPFALNPANWSGFGRRSHDAWEDFVTCGTVSRPGLIRPFILDRWQAARSQGVDPCLSHAPTVVTDDEIEQVLAEDDFAQAGRRVLDDSAQVVAGTEHSVLLSDARGCVLHVTGARSVTAALHAVNARAGGMWNEAVVGTNGIGTTLVASAPTVVFGAEHFCRSLQSWVCCGAPVRDPLNGEFLGTLNVTGCVDRTRVIQLPLAISLARSIEYLLLTPHHRRLQILLEAFRKTESRFLRNGVLGCDAADNVLFTNARAAETLRRLGASPDEVIRHPEAQRLLRGPGPGGEVAVSLPGGDMRVTVVNVRCGPRAAGAVLVLEATLGLRALRVDRPQLGSVFAKLAGSHPDFVRALRLAERAAACEEIVLITGETGTGKELVATAIHGASSRAARPLVVVNCAALPRDLIDSELFGYDAGAFTGACREGKPGRFELADGGTLFLDEIGELALDLQAKLLRVLDERTVFRVGGRRSRAVDVRILVATNRNLAQAVASGEFRLDLYHRVNVLEIVLPPLRERGLDVLTLARLFLDEGCVRAGRPSPVLSTEAEEAMRRYPWPGNIRELRNVIARLVHLVEGDVVTVAELPTMLRSVPAWNVAPPASSLKAMEAEFIRRTLEACGGNVSEAARQLGTDRSTVYRRLRRTGHG